MRWADEFPSFTVQKQRKKAKKIYPGSDGGRWINRDRTTNQKWLGTREERMEKRGEGGGAGAGCQCAVSAGGGREVAM